MGKIIFTIALSSICLLSMAQVRVVDTSAFDSIAVLKGAVGVEHLIGIQKSTKVTAQKCGLKVFIENAEQDDIIGATVQVMDAKRQIAGGVTDFMGFAYVPLVEAGTYDIVIRHIMIGKAKFRVTIKSNTIYELRKVLTVRTTLQELTITNDSIIPKVFISNRKSYAGLLKVFIENAEKDDIIAATVQVMDGEHQIAGGVTDFAGFLYLPNIGAGTYTVVIRHIKIGEAKFQVTIKSNSISEIREELTCKPFILGTAIKAGGILTDGYKAEKELSKGGLKVFIENAEMDDIIAATVQVMDGERQVTGASTDFTGYVYLPNIEAGTYTVVIRHINVGVVKFEIAVKENEVHELRETLETQRLITDCRFWYPEPIFGQDPGMTSYTTEDILRSPSVMRN